MDDFSKSVQEYVNKDSANSSLEGTISPTVQDAPPPNDFSQAVQNYVDKQYETQAPSDVQSAQQDVGQNDLNGHCEQWVEKQAGLPNMGTTAYNAFNNFADKGMARQDWQNMSAGDLIYFSDPKNKAGHVGIVSGVNPQTGNMSFISATDNGVKSSDISEWQKETGQTPLGYISKSDK